MTWYNVVDYNVSFHETKNILIYLHIGSIQLIKTSLSTKAKVKNITYLIEGNLPYKIDSKTCFAEKVKLSFNDSTKAQLFIAQLERAFSNGVKPQYNKENGWVSIQTSRSTTKIDLRKELPK